MSFQATTSNAVLGISGPCEAPGTGVTNASRTRPDAASLWPKPITGMRSLLGFGGDQLPVRIARGDVERERPYVGDLGHLVRIALDDGTVAVPRHRHELRHEADGHLRGASTHLRPDDLGGIDRHEAGLG